MELIVLLRTMALNVASQPIFTGNKCYVTNTNHDELCSIEYPMYRINVNRSKHFTVTEPECTNGSRSFQLYILVFIIFFDTFRSNAPKLLLQNDHWCPRCPCFQCFRYWKEKSIGYRLQAACTLRCRLQAACTVSSVSKRSCINV